MEEREQPKQDAPAFATAKIAAAQLGIDEDALRARCRRAARRRGDIVIAHLGGGIVAFKFGRSWRFRFPSVWATHMDPDRGGSSNTP
jgi:hypothetical protein